MNSPNYYFSIKVVIVFTSFLTLFFCGSIRLFSQINRISTSKLSDTIVIDSIDFKAKALRKTNIDSSIHLFKEAIKISTSINDYKRTAKELNALGINYTIKSDYVNSLDTYQKALNLLKNKNDPKATLNIYNNIAAIYSYFDKPKIARSFYLKSIDILDQYPQSINARYHKLSLRYINLAITYKNEDDKKAFQYLKKALTFLRKSSINQREKIFVESLISIQEGAIYLGINKLKTAKKLLLDNLIFIEEYDDSFITCEAYYFVGLLYQALHEYDKSKSYFIKAIELSDQIKDIRLKSKILLNLAELCESNQESGMAFKYFKKGIKLKDSIFGTKNSWEISQLNSNFKTKLNQKQLVINEKELKITSILNWIYYISSVLVLGIVLLYFNKQKSKHKLEKKRIENREEDMKLKLSETKDVLELKNKELTTLLLQALENEEFVKKINTNLVQIKTEIPKKYHSILEKLNFTIQNNSKCKWKEFKATFEQVNQNFYSKLKESYPDLTPSELKLCSLLKLNLSTKDISNLMGISYDSVKMGRYRVRKKLKLSREVNLVGFISQF
ncbi:tetratricopeptide repeat protein [Tenacibaculum jejuense]|uniref:HTH luxR-type domain-containing protein n=1 Tax=Tenacibaculum jejuense TaxID=584609 RepID=A0A238UGB4_9FLAO|nr:tetratricopeptide repeat protein [Tenacibaculum jejuense]SNR17474.1 Probable transmembrane protein of unknown function containing tetratricopeptide repeats [Tenacibaculum jejuense]